jgi:F420-non-reducing hydrogenase iron-sulfur subunit
MVSVKVVDMAEFEPKIATFACNWCSYAGADVAGRSRIQYPPNARIIRVMCTGRVDPVHILKSIRDGIDCILIVGCRFGDCHYERGNYAAEKRIGYIKKALEGVGINPERVRFETVSSSEGEKFARTIEETVDLIKELGPNPLTAGEGAA